MTIAPTNTGPLHPIELLPGDTITFHTLSKGERQGTVTRVGPRQVNVACTDHTRAFLRTTSNTRRHVTLLTQPTPTQSQHPDQVRALLRDHPNHRLLTHTLDLVSRKASQGYYTGPDSVVSLMHTAAAQLLGVFAHHTPLTLRVTRNWLELTITQTLTRAHNAKVATHLTAVLDQVCEPTRPTTTWRVLDLNDNVLATVQGNDLDEASRAASEVLTPTQGGQGFRLYPLHTNELPA